MNQPGILHDLSLDDAHAPGGTPSVLHALNQANRRLEKLLADLRNTRNAESELLAIAREVLAAVELNADIALACIFLNQINGTYAVRHCIETAIVATLVARRMQRSRDEMLVIAAAALTMNVGMLRHQNSFNKTSNLTYEEMAIVRRHPEESAGLLRDAGVNDREWLSCVLLHHENDDGSGYPCGLRHDEISQNARLVGLADRYCAQVSARNYRSSVMPDQALHNLLGEQASSPDPALAAHFSAQLGAYPPGTLVRLRNGEVGVVTQRDEDGDLHIQCLRDADGKLLRNGAEWSLRVRRASEPDCAIAASLSEDEADVRFSMRQIWGEQASL